MDMNCKVFRENLDAYIDSELDRETRRAMEEHAAACPDCGALLEQAIQTATLCAELNEGLTVPLECQAAWRRAVREEASEKTDEIAQARSKRRARGNGWVRALSGLAAALVILFAVGTQLDMDGFELPSRNSKNSARSANYYDDYDAYRYEEAVDYDSAAGGYSASPLMSASAASILLESDGSVQSSTTTAAQKNASEPIVLRSATRSIKTKEFEADSLYIDDLANEYGAYFESRRVTGNAEDASRLLTATIRVPSESLDNFLTALDVIGTITVREESAEDITSNYNDIAARLEVLRSQLEQLNAMNAKAKNVSDLIEINQRANEVTAEIEAYESRMRDWNSRRSYSSVSLTLTEKRADEPEAPSTPLSERMREAFENSIQWLKDFGQNLAVFGAALLPRLVVWVPVIIIVIVLLRIAFGRRKKK